MLKSVITFDHELCATAFIRTDGSELAGLPEMPASSSGSETFAADSARGRQIRIRMSRMLLDLRHDDRETASTNLTAESNPGV
jgi:hypothetical protein